MIGVLLVGSLFLVTQSPAPAARPALAGTWAPVDPARSDKLYDVGLSAIPGGGRLTIEQTTTRFTVTIAMPDERLEQLLSISGRFYPTIVYRVYDTGRAGGAGAAGPQAPTMTSWIGEKLVIPDARPGARPITMTFSMEGDRLKLETLIEIGPARSNTVTEVFAKVK